METDSRAVSPVVSVILTVAITILLAAVVSAFVLSLGDGTSEEGPSVSLSVEQEGDQLMVTHAAGDTINTSDLRLTGMKGWGPSAQEFTGGGSKNLADGWTFGKYATESEIEQTDERSLSGDYSMKFSDLTQSYSGREILSEPVDVTSGKEYNFGASYYLTKFSDNPAEDDQFLEIIWLDSSGSEISTDPSQGSNFSVSGEWREFSESKNAPLGAVAAKLEISAKEGNTQDPDVHWDEAFIEPVP